MQGDPGLIPPPPPGTRVVKASTPAGAPTPVVIAATPGPLEASPIVQTDSETVRIPAPAPPSPPSSRPAAPSGPVQLSVSPPSGPVVPPPVPAARAVAAAAAAEAPVAVLCLPDGTQVAVDAALVLGRRPAAPEQQADAVPVVVDDPDKTVSKTHALLRPLVGFDGAGAAVELTDLHSTNGTGYSRDEAVMLEAGGSATVVPPASIWLGTCRLELT